MDWPDRWNHIEKVLERSGPFAHEDFNPGSEAFDFVHQVCNVLVIGAGGLGCELLKNLALMGFRNIEVIDMDIIEVSNLNRQFLFRAADVGKPKAEVAAAHINKRIAGCNVVPHYKKIQDFDESFYQRFHIIVCGLDSIVARRWINGMLVGINTEESAQDGAIIPMIDGGTEGFKGNVRVMLPSITACIDCTLDLYPPQVTFPLCTIAQTPRLPEHCIEYVKVLLWPKERPDTSIDGDDPEHVRWIYERALERAAEYNIPGVTYRLTQGVIKNIIPAVASTNAVIAAACATEVFKIATSSYLSLNNYMVFNDVDGIYTYTFEAEKKDNCLACSQKVHGLTFAETDKLQVIVDFLIENAEYQMKSPGLTANINGKNKTLYMQSVASIEEATRPNLKKTLKELGIVDGQQIVVADSTTPSSLIFKLNLTSKMES
ncbi:NEDD8-activating enzyme E1 catalytic subunit-like [Argiope bruennichi]|uniref:NEDD8-activating enzyme E1 catalytic subunit-like n=1 Tax=Argiope bruennichi TaxID=94029 RepID=UPI00249419CC|nr:NEDD8-activating enzyme E1 catalytic subunit-like [Argiope bruennichi]XP_055952041.1 NEDD8-activating enzyme E1 catalytic subunit-like [Argiope bruennichi]